VKVSRLALLAVTLCSFHPAWALSCSVEVNGLAFGSYNSIGTGVRDTYALITLRCTGTANQQVNYTLHSTPGNGSYSSRTALATGSSLTYNIYTDSSHTLVWGDGTSGTQAITGSFNINSSGSETEHQITVYGRIPAGQNLAKIGSYADSVTINMIY
jgi:spore coat protein U-like protein